MPTLARVHEVLLAALPAAGAQLRGDVQLRGDIQLRGDVAVQRVVMDSREVRPGDLYAAVPGASADGHDHAPDAVRRGAAAVLCSRWLDLDVPQLRVRRVRAVLGAVAAELCGRPADRLRLVAVTGTNGKTTTALLLHAALLAARPQSRPAVIGTLGSRLGEVARDSPLTTPEAPALHELLRWMADGGGHDVVLEASSIALEQGRLDGLQMALSVHTGLEEEHLDFHGTVEQYWSSKAALFAPGRTAQALVRVDDPWGVRLARQLQIPVTTFGSSPAADVRLERVRTGLAGTTVELSGADGRTGLEVPLLGRVNAVNAAAAYLAARRLGLSREQARDGIAGAAAPPGRHSLVIADDAPLVVVDFAHTPAALAALLQTGRELAARGGRVLLVFGGRGERDRAKRADLARVAAAADLLVLTCDTTERESVDAVLAEYRLGLIGSTVPLVVEQDRREAIAAALRSGRPGDVVLVAGRGAEPLLRVHGTARRFVDREVVEELLGGPAAA
ncbi:MAG TPA: UDP-N-acetylmuramyl-tripeptide synthetase [Mycobacteriales bacterium]|jgi:UDP-N-acetylmuramoyl-L-alanyl-D-glutamate--2,6-diaminopimelate ligase|nr:UDP-N-acetylmuramyl-tripeptide synthetase [Mycobacteriales bacterium]